MRFLHTSDWHLGQRLLTQERTAEHARFLDWLLDTLERERIDALLVAGDVFDSGAPPNYALQLYYDFLRRLPDTCCRHTVIIGGNHDSVATLHAPRELLRRLRIHVVGGASAQADDDVLLLDTPDGRPAALVCAVPFLRDRDVRTTAAGESYEQKSQAWVEGIARHYREGLERAQARRAALGPAAADLPLLATGHLFTRGGQTSEGVRDVYVGALGQVPGSAIADGFAYVALGHLHVPQLVAGRPEARYSGSPLPLSFGEAGQAKQVLVVEPTAAGSQVRALQVPLFQPLCQVRGDLETIARELAAIPPPAADGVVWVEALVDAEPVAGDLQREVLRAAAELPVEILAVRHLRRAADRRLLGAPDSQETLDQLSPAEVFGRRLAAEAVGEPQATELARAFQEIVTQVAEAGAATPAAPEPEPEPAPGPQAAPATAAAPPSGGTP